MRNHAFSLTCVLTAFVCGCSADPTAPSGSVPSEVEARGMVSPESTMIAHVKLSDTHEVEFRENADGIVSVIEKGAIGTDRAILGEGTRDLSLLGLYELVQKRAANPEASKADMARLQKLDEITRFSRAEQAAQPPEEFVDKATIWRNYVAPNFADVWNFWSSSVCRAGKTERCEIGIGGPFSYIKEDDYIVYSHANMSTTVNSTALILWDPCDNANFWEFCTKPFRVVNSATVAPFTFVTQQNWSSGGGNLTWSAHGDGPIWGWALTYSNPRTW